MQTLLSLSKLSALAVPESSDDLVTNIDGMYVYAIFTQSMSSVHLYLILIYFLTFNNFLYWYTFKVKFRVIFQSYVFPGV